MKDLQGDTCNMRCEFVSLVSVGLDRHPNNGDSGDSRFPETVELDLSDFLSENDGILLMALQVQLLVLARNVGFGGTGFTS